MNFRAITPTAVVAALLLCAPATAWGGNLLNTTSFTNSAGESCVKQSFDDGSDTISCVGKSEVEIIDVPVPPVPSSAPPPATAIAAPSQPCAGPASSSTSSGGSSPGLSAAQKRAAALARLRAARQARQASQDRARSKLGYDDVQPIEGGGSGNAPIRGMDYGALGGQIGRLGAIISQEKALDLDTINIEFGDQVGGDTSGGDKFGLEVGVEYEFVNIDEVDVDEVDPIILGANFALGPGVSLLGTVSWVDWNDEEDEAPINNNDGWALLGGLHVKF